MKIAIIGNMNNNGFALMRYFRDLGADAQLFLYANDGIDSLSHFKPENDVFDIHNWNYYIHQTTILNGLHQTLPYWLQPWFFSIYKIRSRLFQKLFLFSSISKNQIRRLVTDYDYIITSGYGPAILNKAGINTNVFFPYTTGVEGIDRRFAPNFKRIGARCLFEWGRYQQIKALKKIPHILISDLGITQKELLRLQIDYKKVALPVIYVEEKIPNATNEEYINWIGKVLDQCDFSVFSHARLAWNKDICEEQGVRSKNNHWLIWSFKMLVNQKPDLCIRLILFEYGPDILKTKELVVKLGLQSYVIWVPKTSRKNIMWLLRKATIGVGEFIESPRMIWGGTGWEVLASSKPLLQGFFFEEGEFKKNFGYPEPPLLKVKSESDVTSHLLKIVDNAEKIKQIGKESGEWFHMYSGRNLARKWLKLLSE